MRFEVESSYRFPSISILFCVFIIVGVFSALTHLDLNLSIIINQPSPADSHPRWEHFTEVIANKAPSIFLTSASNCVFIFIILIPLLVAFNFAQGYNSGLIRTLLTYPISRLNVIGMKVLTIFLLVASSASIGCILGIVFFVPWELLLSKVSYYFGHYGTLDVIKI